MSKQVLNTPEIEAKKIFNHIIEYERMILDYFFEGDVKLPPGEIPDKYLKKVFDNYVLLYLERARNKEKRRLRK